MWPWQDMTKSKSHKKTPSKLSGRRNEPGESTIHTENIPEHDPTDPKHQRTGEPAENPDEVGVEGDPDPEVRV